MRTLRIGLEISDDPAWVAGLLYVKSLLTSLSRLPDGERPVVRLLPVDHGSVEAAQEIAGDSFASLAEGVGRAWVVALRRVQRRLAPRSLAWVGGAPFHDIDVLYPGLGRTVPGVRQIHWVPDLQHRHLPQMFDEGERARRDRRIQSIAERPGVVVLSSEAARRDYETFFGPSSADPQVLNFCSTITYGAITSAPRVADLPHWYLYTPNQFWKHKDHRTLFEALRLLREQTGQRPPLVCTGTQDDWRHPSYGPELMAFLREHDLASQVHLLGVLPRSQQISVFRNAAAVVQPSRFEGWSTVVEDARAVGRPLVLSDIDVHREQMPSARFFTTGSPSSLAGALAAAIEELPAGPDPEAEVAAAGETERRRVTLARRFVDIARHATTRSDS